MGGLGSLPLGLPVALLRCTPWVLCSLLGSCDAPAPPGASGSGVPRALLQCPACLTSPWHTQTLSWTARATHGGTNCARLVPCSSPQERLEVLGCLKDRSSLGTSPHGCSHHTQMVVCPLLGVLGVCQA